MKRPLPLIAMLLALASLSSCRSKSESTPAAPDPAVSVVDRPM